MNTRGLNKLPYKFLVLLICSKLCRKGRKTGVKSQRDCLLRATRYSVTVSFRCCLLKCASNITLSDNCSATYLTKDVGIKFRKDK